MGQYAGKEVKKQGNFKHEDIIFLKGGIVMEYLVEPMQLSGNVCHSEGDCSPLICQCNETTLNCGCNGVDICRTDICVCKGGREGCCGLGGHSPEFRLPPVIS